MSCSALMHQIKCQLIFCMVLYNLSSNTEETKAHNCYLYREIFLCYLCLAVEVLMLKYRLHFKACDVEHQSTNFKLIFHLC